MNVDEPQSGRPRGRPRRGTRSLNLNAIETAALALVDRGGLGCLTMRQLGIELGVDAMAIYHYVPSKEVLHDLIVEAVMAGFVLPEGFESSSLKDGLRSAARAYRDAVLAHPHTLPVLATRPMLTPGALMTIERILGFLASHGLDPVRGVAAINAFSAYVLGSLFSWTAHTTGGPEHAHGGIPWEQLDPRQVPHLLALAQATGGSPSFETTFDDGLDWLIEGLERINARAGRGTAPESAPPAGERAG